MTTAEAIYRESFASGFLPDTELTVSEWAGRYRMLTTESSGRPGRWDNGFTPFAAEPMDCLSASSPVRKVVFQGPRQVVKTEILVNWIGYCMHQSPGAMLIVEPTIELVKLLVRQRVDPMIRGCPELKRLVAAEHTRDPKNSTFNKEFLGGIARFTTASSASALRQMPVRNLGLDEVDAYDEDLDNEGDPIGIAEKSTDGFPNAKIYITSTPTLRHYSRVERERLLGDDCRYYIPCPFCGNLDWIRFENFKMQTERDPTTTQLLCEACGEYIPEWRKTKMMDPANGACWRPTNDKPKKGVRSFQLSKFYAPLGSRGSWENCMVEFLESAHDPPRLKQWWNTVRAETWEDRGEAIDTSDLVKRQQVYPRSEAGAYLVPHGVGIVTVSCDLQKDRLEMQAVGWGAAEESWLLDFQRVYGSPDEDWVWAQLDVFRRRAFAHESGRAMKAEACTVDTGGHWADRAYAYCKSRESERVFAVKGGSQPGKEVVGRPSNSNRHAVNLFVLGVNASKEIIHGRLKISTPGPGYIHFPQFDAERLPHYDLEYMDQMTSEARRVIRIAGGGFSSAWEPVPGKHNEAWDLWQYSLAALYICGPALIRSLPERAAWFSRPLNPDAAISVGNAPTEPVPAARVQPPPVRRPVARRGSWMGRVR